MFGSKIHCHIIPITIIGVINGKKYAVLKYSEPRILQFKITAIIRGIMTPNTDDAKANTTVFKNILPNNWSAIISL